MTILREDFLIKKLISKEQRNRTVNVFAIYITRFLYNLSSHFELLLLGQGISLVSKFSALNIAFLAF